MKEKNDNQKLRNGIIIVSAFFIGMLAMFGLIRLYPSEISETITKIQKDVTVTDTGIADAVEKLYDSVVVVYNYQNNSLTGSGTGFVYKIDNKTAYILTNNHVVENADTVKVTFTNGEIVETKVVGTDVYSDIAVLSVSKDKVSTVATIGSSNDLRLGDTLFAIGSPISKEYSWSVTRGILSGKDRLVEVQLSNSNTTMVVKTLQTDTAINPGNSGGPIANSNGDVIGITSIKLSSSKIEGMGFAIPIEDAIKIAEQLISGKSLGRPYLGIYMLDVSQGYYSRQYYSLIQEAKVTQGIIVTEIEKKDSKLEVNDIITKVDGIEVSSSGYLRYYLYTHNPGDVMTLTVIRNGKEKEVKVTLTEKPEN